MADTARTPAQTTLGGEEGWAAVRAEAREALRRWRRDTAEAMRQPPYYVFADKTLDEIVLRWPRSREALAEVKGVGPAKLERYADEVLGLLARFPPPPPPPGATRSLALSLPVGLMESLEEAASEEGRGADEVALTAVRHYLVARQHFLEEGYRFEGRAAGGGDDAA